MGMQSLLRCRISGQWTQDSDLHAHLRLHLERRRWPRAWVGAAKASHVEAWPAIRFWKADHGPNLSLGEHRVGRGGRTGLGASCPSVSRTGRGRDHSGPLLASHLAEARQPAESLCKGGKLDPHSQAASSQGDEQTSLYCGAQALGRPTGTEEKLEFCLQKSSKILY